MQRQMRKFCFIGWLTLKILLLQGLIWFKVYFLKIEYEGKKQISKSSLFHSTNVDEKKRIKRKAIACFKLGNHQVLAVSCLV